MGKSRKLKHAGNQVHHDSALENIKPFETISKDLVVSKNSFVQNKLCNELASVHEANSPSCSIEDEIERNRIVDLPKEIVLDKVFAELSGDSPISNGVDSFIELGTCNGAVIVDSESKPLDSVDLIPVSDEKKAVDAVSKFLGDNEPVKNSCYCSSVGSVREKTAKKHKKSVDEVERLLKEIGLGDEVTSAKSDEVDPSASSPFQNSCQINCDIQNNEISKAESVIENFCNIEVKSSNNGVLLNGSEVPPKASLKKKEKKLRQKQRKENDRIKGSTDLSEISANANSENENINVCVDRSVEIEKGAGKKEDLERKDKKRPSKKLIAIIQEAVRKAKEKEEKTKMEEEAKRKIAEESERLRLEKLRLEQEKKEKKKLKEKQKKEKLKAEGKLLSKSQKQARARLEATLAIYKEQGIKVPEINSKGSDSKIAVFPRRRLDSSLSVQSNDSIVLSDRHKTDSLSSQESSNKDNSSEIITGFESADDMSSPDSEKCGFSDSDVGKAPNATSKSSSNSSNATATLDETNKPQSNTPKLRSPVVCVLGHVDTGKTKILDYIRKTHVQDSEAGGITQQIGATMIPKEALKEKCRMVKNFNSFEIKIPGLLVIDTPGHESFQNLRSRGSSVCDLAVLIVDIMHGLEPQTLESINLLKQRKTPFIVALNKVDRLYGWKSSKDDDVESTIKNQSPTTLAEFKKRCQEVILQFAKECLNAALFYENLDPRSFVSMIPTSAVSGDGMGNLLAAVAQLTQTLMRKKLVYSEELEATVLEVKTTPGLGTTIDVILVNGCLREGDTIVLAAQDGPFVTQIRSLLMPHPLKELRVKNPYVEHKSVEGAQGIKVTGRDLDKAIAGLPLFVANTQSKIDACKEEVNRLLRDTINSIKTSERGVYVQASTLGSLEALLKYLSDSGVPYFSVKIGPVVKKDVMKASIMLEHDIQYAAILAFDVKIDRDAQELADTLGVHIFHADIIYHLFDMYIEFKENLMSKRREETRRLVVYPCKLKVLPDYVMSVKDPISLVVRVEDGTLKLGTPLCTVSTGGIVELGSVAAMELNKNKVSSASKGEEVLVKIECKFGESKTYGKHFTYEDLLVSRITRQSIDICKEHFRDELLPSDWHLIVELKKLLHIP